MRITRSAANYLDEGGTRYLLEQIHDVIDETIEIGTGVPTGGTTGQVLAKKSNTDFDTEWVDGSGGGGGGTSNYNDLSNKPSINGHVLTGNQTAADLDIPGATYEDATQSTHGLMSTTDKIKLDGIEANANRYVHPTTSGYKHIPSGGSAGQVLGWAADGTAAWVNSGGGGGGGSTVTITPTLSTGTKIADFTIDSTSGSLYAPSGGGGDMSNYYTKAETEQLIEDDVSSALRQYATKTYSDAGDNAIRQDLHDDYYDKNEIWEIIPTEEIEVEIPSDGSQQMGLDGYSCWVGIWDGVYAQYHYDYQTHILPSLCKNTPYIKFSVDSYFEFDPLELQNLKNQYDEGNLHFVDAMIDKVEAESNAYAGCIQASDGTTTYSNTSGQNYVNVPNPEILTDLQYTLGYVNRYRYLGSGYTFGTTKTSNQDTWGKVKYVQFRCNQNLGVLNVHFATKNSNWNYTNNPIGIKMFTSIDNVFSLNALDSDFFYRQGYYDQYFDYTVDTNRYSNFYFFYDGIEFEQFTLTVTDQNSNVITFTEQGSLYKLEALEDYKIYGSDLPAHGEMIQVIVHDNTRDIDVLKYVPWITPTKIHKFFYTDGPAHEKYRLDAPGSYDETKFIHSVTTPTIVTRKVPVDMDDYYKKEETQDIIQELVDSHQLDGADGTTFTPSVTAVTGGYNLSWTNDGGKTNPPTVTITNGINGTNGTDGVDGQDGRDGRDGVDGTDGVSPTVTVTSITGGHQVSITDATATNTFNVMDGINGTNGTNGRDGTDGVDGVSPTATVTSTSSGATITITDKNGTTTANISNGTNGTNGTDGQDGADGFSPTATITQSSSGATISITDKNGTSVANIFNGTNGTNGTSPTATVTQTSGGATITIMDINGTTTANITNGANGTNGTNGQDGVSPTVSTTTITGGHQVSITDATGTSSFNVMDGQQGATGATGATGPQGPAGYTPVRGTDYWTAADIATIQNYIDTELGVISNGSY